MLEVNEIKKGRYFKFKKNPYKALNVSHTHIGRGQATIKIKAEDLNSGAIIELSFKSGEKVEDLEITKKKGTFLYKDNEHCFFMDSETYEQIELPNKILGEYKNFLKEGEEVEIIYIDATPKNIEIPLKVKLKVIYTEPGIRGDTVQGSVTKQAKLETGYTLDVPLFIEIGDEIIVNTETGEYVEKAKKN